MVCQPRVCMRMCNTKYCIVEVASKRFYKSCSRLNRKTIPLDIPEAHGVNASCTCNELCCSG